LKGFPEAIEAIFPATVVQTCIVHYADLRVMPTCGREALSGAVIELARSA
jgi:putative transposase